MIKKPKPVDFEYLFKKVRGSNAGKNELAIWGGRCAEGELPDLVERWTGRADMPYRIWEYVDKDKILFEKNRLPENPLLLERGRLFGPDGDLRLRREGKEFSWSFTGKAGLSPPPGFPGVDFWQGNGDVLLHRYDEAALLWGERKPGRTGWHDNRVAHALLNYPAPEGWKRVQVSYSVFCREGRVEFVWLQGLREWKEV
jgi:hypothetical protein